LRRIKIYKIGKFDPFDKENSIFEEEHSKIVCVKDSIGIFQGLIEFIEGIIARKINS
jgi:hypothetical protein